MFRTSRMLVVLFVAVLGGCSPGGDRAEEAGPERAGDESRAGDAGEGARAEEPAVPVVEAVARDFAFEVQGPIPAGLTTIRLANRGRSTHHMQLYRLAEGKSAADLVEAIKAATSGGEFPDWIEAAGGPGGVSPGAESNATMELEPGSYALVCWVPDTTGVPHLLLGMVKEVQVVPAERDAEPPEPDADLTVRLVDYDFQFSPPPASGSWTMRVENEGPQRHEIQIWRLAPGKSVSDFMTYMGNHERGEPPGRWAGGVSELEPGGRAHVRVDLPPGEYALICFVPDQKDGKPHFAHGMVKQITVGDGRTAGAPASAVRAGRQRRG